MVCLILLLLLLPFIDVNGSINLTYIVKKDANKIQPSCIAEESERYAAVGWVYPIPTNEQDIPNITTKFIPNIQNNYNCKFSKNDFCNKRWFLRDWSIDKTSIRTHDFIGDRRWEDLPTIFISNTTKEFKERIELIGNVFRTGFSVRANGIIELFICSGWNPYNYPCYYFNIDNREIYFNKFSMLPKDSTYDFKSSYLGHYKAFSNILSHDEWRNFVISIDEDKIIKLFDVNLNRTVIEHADKEPLTTEFLLMRSRYGSLWKFHENQFLYTNTTQVSRLGPQLTIVTTDLCVSLLVTTCENCEMIFFYQNASVRKVLKYIGPMENNEWMEIKLKEENIQTDKLNLFVETKFKDLTLNETAGFWAVDDIRICNENEVKVSYLKLNSTVKENEVSEEYISCQLIKKPSWRPKKLLYNKIKGFPEVLVTNNSTSIKLSWTQEDPEYQINYFIFYQGNDICASEPYNLRRIKSNGFLTTKHNEIVIDELVPYTTYNVTFSSVLHETDKQLYLNTLETVEPTLEELPDKIQIRASDSIVYVSWEKVNCTYRYGRLIYTLIVSNEKLNFTKELLLQTDNKYKINGLVPYTPYTLKIQTARNGGNIYKGIHTSSIILNFTTLAGVAPPVENLEVYSIDQNSASIRFDLPKNAKGVPKEVQISKCIALSFDKCKTYVSQLKHCTLWPNKYCVLINNLIPYKKYLFKISLKNFNTQMYGKEVVIEGFTIDQVPGAPVNIKYEMVDCNISTDYCHLNIKWSHPYYQNGTITSFNIILNSTDKHKNSEEDKYIHEVYRIENKSYSSNYTYQIKYLPYSTSYTLYLQSANAMYRSNFTKLIVKTDNIGDHIDQSPKLLGKSDNTLLFKIPHIDRRLNFYTIIIIVQDFDHNKTVEPDLLENNKIADNICHKYGETWISHTLRVENNDTENVMIGNSEKGKIKPNTQYCITFIITNKYKDSEHDVVYYEKLMTPDSPTPTKEASSSSSYNHLYILLLLLLLVPIGFLIYRCLRKRRVIKKPVENNENVYESLPFEECETNCVNNDNYDHLLHK